jgi:hypothetical protein
MANLIIMPKVEVGYGIDRVVEWLKRERIWYLMVSLSRLPGLFPGS